MGDENLKNLRKGFWQALRKHLKESGSFLQLIDSKDGHWLNFRLGVIDGIPSVPQYVTIVWCHNNKKKGVVDCSRYHVRVTYDGLNGRKDNLQASQRWFEFMSERQSTSHSQLGLELKWDNKRKFDVYLEAQPVIADIRNLDAWPGYINDMSIQAKHLHEVFQPHALAFSKEIGCSKSWTKSVDVLMEERK